MIYFSDHVGGVRATRGRDAPTGVAPWKVVAAAVAIIVILASVGLLLRAHGFFGASPASSSGGGSRVDLCNTASGSNCKGQQFVLPLQQFGRTQTVSGCDSVVPSMAGAHLVLAYATTSLMQGVLVPSSLYWGTNVSFSADPNGFFNSSFAVQNIAWTSGFTTGNSSIDAPIPSTAPQWCLAWWDPGSAGMVTFGTDAYLAY